MFLVLLVPYASLKKSRRVAALCVLLASVSIYSQQDALGRYADMNAYHRLFFGLLLTTEPKHSREILQELELTPHAGRIGISFWQSSESLGELPPGKDMEESERLDLVSRATVLSVLRLYLQNPQLIGRGVTKAIGLIRSQPARINYLAYSNCDDARLLRYLDAWPALYNGSFPLLLVLPLLAIFSVKDRAGRSFLAAQLCMCLAGYGLVVLGDGFWEFQKHLVPVSFATSLLLIFSVMALSERATTRPEGQLFR